MTTKRFTTKNIICSNYCVWDNNDKPYGNDEVVELLNELHEENQQYKALLQDLGLLMTDEEVIDIRTEIADKLIKPLFKENGFDVDVDCSEGFTISPKGGKE